MKVVLQALDGSVSGENMEFYDAGFVLRRFEHCGSGMETSMIDIGALSCRFSKIVESHEIYGML